MAYEIAVIAYYILETTRYDIKRQMCYKLN